MGTDALSHPDDEARSSVEGSGDGGGTSGGGSGTRGGADDEPDRFVRLLLRLRDLLFRRKRNVVPYVSAAQATAHAGVRTRALEDTLLGAAWAPVAEAPSNLEKAADRIPVDEDERLHALVTRERAEWQAGSAPLLLASRAGDLVVTLLADEAEEFGVMVERTQPLISVTMVPRWLRRLRPALFPWRVEVRTTDAAYLTARLRPYAEWLGIGVDVVKGRPMGPQSTCASPGAQAGTVAGALSGHGGELMGLTCAHVVGTACSCARWRARLPQQGTTGAPDAATLDTGAPCFPIPAAGLTHLRCATRDELTELHLDGRPVHRIGGRRLGRDGTITVNHEGGGVGAPATTLYTLDKGLLGRFPAVVITPRPSLLGRLLGPLGERAFSRGGDSGSWVVDPATGTWVGMVVCGDAHHQTVALNARELTAHIDRVAHPVAPEEGYTWSI
jgi:hypothetical protein